MRGMIARQAAWNFALALAAFLLAWVPTKLSLPSGSLNDVIWPLAGFVLGSILLWGAGVIPALMIGEFIVALMVGLPVLQALWVAGWEVLLWGGGSAWVLRRFGGYRDGFDGLASVLGLILLPVGLCLGLRVVVGTFFRVGFGWTTWDKFWETSPAIWLSVAAGVLIVTPLMVAGVTGFRWPPGWSLARCAEALALAAGLTMTCHLLVPRVLVADAMPVMPFLVFPFFIWAALRFGVAGVGASSLLLGIVCFERFFFSEAFGEDALQDAMLFYQSLLVVATITGLLVAGALADRRRAVEGLETIVTERTAELRAANDGKEKLLAIIGHDMRTPLFGIVKLSEFLMETATTIHPSKLAVYAGEMHQSAKDQIETMENLLNWARLRSGQAVYRPEQQSLEVLVEPVLNLFQLRARLRNVSLCHELPVRVSVLADPEMTRAILRNLISNAIQAADLGGTVRVEARVEGDGVVISVIDDGAGMKPEEVAALRAQDEASSPRGLGFVLVREFCRLQDARLEIESRPALGTRMSFRLRLA